MNVLTFSSTICGWYCQPTKLIGVEGAAKARDPIIAAADNPAAPFNICLLDSRYRSSEEIMPVPHCDSFLISANRLRRKITFGISGLEDYASGRLSSCCGINMRDISRLSNEIFISGSFFDVYISLIIF
ncbi:hypothetical protein [Rhizobium sp. CF142]|uniref:hypothetical protein n=1 Tax=Rhizobium sp. CF142 TaxID=1144314 RepID=UPI001FCC1FE7|nr:hypothetical protein [Rhizobium sp. CF142]